MATASTLMTTEELLAMPEDGVDRWIVDGELRERPMARRNRFHSYVEARLSQMLWNWIDRQPEPRGQVHSGEAGVRLLRNPDTTFGVDVAYITASFVAQQTDEITIIEGIPTLVAEILSPSDTQEDVHEKIGKYLQAGVSLIWIIDPADRTVREYRAGARPQLFNEDHELSGEPHLPGFKTPVARLFG